MHNLHPVSTGTHFSSHSPAKLVTKPGSSASGDIPLPSALRPCRPYFTLQRCYTSCNRVSLTSMILQLSRAVKLGDTSPRHGSESWRSGLPALGDSAATQAAPSEDQSTLLLERVRSVCCTATQRRLHRGMRVKPLESAALLLVA
jgi:hypothetical protein